MRLASRWLAPPVLTLLLSDPRPARAAPSDADSAYSSYRVPDHRWTQVTADLSGGAQRASSTAMNGVENRSGDVRGRLNGRAAWGFDSDPSTLLLDFSASVFALRTHQEFLQVSPPTRAEDDLGAEYLFETFHLTGAWNRYPWAAPVGLTLAVSNDFALAQEFLSSTELFTGTSVTNKSLSSSAAHGWRYLGRISAGAGVGRVRDLTPVYQAQVLEDRLRRTGALSGPLSRGAREKIAALFTTQPEVKFAHQRADKYFWEALERVLREDGALERGSLDAYSAHRVLEPIVPTGSIFRRRGFFVGPGLVLRTNQSQDRLEQSQSFLAYAGDSLVFSSGTSLKTKTYSRSDDVLTSILAQYNRPLGLRWQLDAFHNTLVGEAGEFVTGATIASMTYMVSDRWVAGVRARHNFDASGHGSALGVDHWSAELAADLYYFLEDSWALSVHAAEFQDHTRAAFIRSGGVEIGISRIFTGYFELPGVAPAMRATPPLR